MRWKKNVEKVPGPVDMNTGIELLRKQIEAAKQMLMNRPIPSKEYAAWNDQTKSILIRIYGEDSPNIDTITAASGKAPTWLFIRAEVAEQHTASCLDNKRQLLEGCVVALRRKAKQVA